MSILSDWKRHVYEPEVAGLRATITTLRAQVDDLRSQIDREATLTGQLLAAVSWVEPPFVDENTSESELRQRVGFLLKDVSIATARLDDTGSEAPGRTKTTPGGQGND